MTAPHLVERTNHGHELYEAAFGHHLHGPVSIADIGAGNSDFWLKASQAGKNVLRVDAQYGRLAPEGEGYLSLDARDMHDLPDESFDATVSAFMMQHLGHGNGDVRRAVSEMVRITKTDEARTKLLGVIAIFPVWRPDRIEHILAQDFRGLADVGYVSRDHYKLLENYRGRGGHRLSNVPLQTLLIRKTPDLTPEKSAELGAVLEDSKALKPKLGLIKGTEALARKVTMAATGHTIYPVG